jgi:hypothetical protein
MTWLPKKKGEEGKVIRGLYNLSCEINYAFILPVLTLRERVYEKIPLPLRIRFSGLREHAKQIIYALVCHRGVVIVLYLVLGLEWYCSYLLK